MNLFDTLPPVLPDTWKNAATEDLIMQARERKKILGSKVFIPGHHYQREEVIQFADVTGDSLQLAQQSASRPEAEVIVFLGVHFMAETADIITPERQKVILPDLRAGCSMADMATQKQCEAAWETLTEFYGETIIPVTYVNSSADVKAFVGKHGGATVTSSNAAEVMKWAYTQKERVLFLPDQHLGRNTAYAAGMPREEMVVWNQITNELQPDIAGTEISKAKLLLWKGHCSVHENFRMIHVENIRRYEPDRKILVHPECSWEVTQASDKSGSTKYIIDQVKNAAPGTKWAIGTEMNLVKRLALHHPEQSIVSLNPQMCPCLTMNRIDLPHFVWVLDEIVSGRMVHQIKVKEETAYFAREAIERMMKLV
ncbi:quinolinate synthase NadA [Alkalicoccus daliensis]|uniref:Quinolinate synthase n=1 Tax=Alkalicoccus daliensis TaxID=745820 RepID=A0A1H0DQ52_9BACI|nr:quinolinate synthase NadA [Alkalicoccus daliensis]SDN72163.1 quinolinate synthetase [Alkalicoccus daliensis]